MKLQGSGPSGPEILQSQTSQSGKNRLLLNRFAVIHGRLNILKPYRDTAKVRGPRFTAGLP